MGTLTVPALRPEQVHRVAELLGARAPWSVVLSGPPGCGKGPVARNALRGAGWPGPDVTLVCSEHLATRRLGVLAPYLGADGASGADGAGRSSGAGDSNGDGRAATDPASLPLGEAVARLSAALLRVVGAAAGQQEDAPVPLVVVQEGRFLDQDSAQALALLAGAGALRLLVLTTDQDPSSPVLSVLLADAAVRLVLLAPLEADEARELVRQRLDGTVGEAALTRLVAWGAGNPQLLAAVVEQALHSRALLRRAERWVLDHAWEPSGALLDEAVVDVLQRQGPGVASALHGLAVAGAVADGAAWGADPVDDAVPGAAGPDTTASDAAGAAVGGRSAGAWPGDASRPDVAGPDEPGVGLGELLSTGLVVLTEGAPRLRTPVIGLSLQHRGLVPSPRSAHTAAHGGPTASRSVTQRDPGTPATHGDHATSGGQGVLREVVDATLAALQARGAAAAATALEARVAQARLGWAAREHGTLSLLRAVIALASGRHQLAAEHAREAAAELWLRDPLGLAGTAQALIADAPRHPSGPPEPHLGEGLALLAAALRLTEAEPLQGSQAVAWAAAACRADPPVARLALLAVRNATRQPTATARVRALGAGLREGWGEGHAGALFAVDPATPLPQVLSRLEAAHAAGDVLAAVHTLQWVIETRGEAEDPADQLALRRLLGKWVQGVRAVAGDEVPAGLGGAVALTERELEITRRTQAGLSNRQIARELFLSQRTVEGHLYRAFQKLGISQRQELEGLVLRGPA